MKLFPFLFIVSITSAVELTIGRGVVQTNRDSDYNYQPQVPIQYHQQQLPMHQNGILVRSFDQKDLATALQTDPLLATLILSYNLHVAPKPTGFNHPQHLPVNPYLSLLLSHYGRYIPTQSHGPGIYGYAAANNYLNNLPFGSYKLYEDVNV